MNWFCSFQKKISLTLFNQQSHTHNHSEAITMPPFPQGPRFPLLLLPSWESQGVVIHDASLPLSPQFSLSDAPFLGAPRRWSVFSTHWGKTWLDTSPVALPDPVAIPSELVRPSNESRRGLAIWRVRTLIGKRTWNTVRWRASPFILGFLHSSPAKPLVARPGWSKGTLRWTSRTPPDSILSSLLDWCFDSLDNRAPTGLTGGTD